MKRIFAIGGGEIRDQGTLSIDKAIIAASNKDFPKILFIPTASSDAEGYIDTFKEYFGDHLGCDVDVLALTSDNLSYDDIKIKILETDIVYVGGGNTRMMMKLWKKHRVDELLIEAYNKGVVMSGLSAGSICWFRNGQSDSDTYEFGKKMAYTVVEGLGIIPMLHCPHHNEDNRASDFLDKVENTKSIGLAIENDCAIEIKDNKFRIIKSNEDAKAYKVYLKNNKVIQETLDSLEEYRDLSYLLK